LISSSLFGYLESHPNQGPKSEIGNQLGTSQGMVEEAFSRSSLVRLRSKPHIISIAK